MFRKGGDGAAERRDAIRTRRTIEDACVAGTLFDAYMIWVMNEQILSKEEMIDTIGDFLSGGLGKIYNGK